MSLASEFADIRKTWGKSEADKLLTALKIRDIAEKWNELYRKEAGGVSCRTYVWDQLRFPLNKFVACARVVSRLGGREIVPTLTWAIAYWLREQVTDQNVDAIREELMRLYRTNRQNPPSKEVAKISLEKVLGMRMRRETKAQAGAASERDVICAFLRVNGVAEHVVRAVERGDHWQAMSAAAEE